MSEQGPSISQYIDSSGSTESIKRLRERVAKTFENQDARDIHLREREKNEFDHFIINLADQDLNHWRQEFDLPEYHVPENNIHIIPAAVWEPARAKVGGEFVPLFQEIAVQDVPDELRLAESIYHELTHFHSYAAVEIDYRTARDYRLGLTTYTRPDHVRHFNPLNEAITAELSKRFLLGLRTRPEFAKIYEQTEDIRSRAGQVKDREGQPLFSEDVYAAVINNKTENKYEITTQAIAYRPERLATWAILDKLGAKTNQAQENIFREFAQAMFDGKILGIGKKIERAFGPGSFRRLGECRTAKELTAFLDSIS